MEEEERVNEIEDLSATSEEGWDKDRGCGSEDVLAGRFGELEGITIIKDSES